MVDGSHDDASTIQPRYFAVCTRLRAVSRYKKYKNLAISRQFATTHDASNARRAIFYFSLPLRKTTTTRKYFPKNAAILPSKDLLFPRSAISISDSRRNLAVKRGNLERTHHYVKDATSLVLRRPTRAFLHSRATSPVNSRQLALSTNS